MTPLRQHFDGNVAFEARIGGAVHGPHAALAKSLAQLIMGDGSANHKAFTQGQAQFSCQPEVYSASRVEAIGLFLYPCADVGQRNFSISLNSGIQREPTAVGRPRGGSKDWSAE
jgi:hypothetical protein